MIYVVGNLTKDVYLKLTAAELPTDAAGVPWLDLPFDGGERVYTRRASVHSGMAVTLECFRKFGAAASYIDQPVHHRDYRYLLSAGAHVACFTPAALLETLWQTPGEKPEAIWVDYTAHLTREVRAEILQYLEDEPTVGLCGWAGLNAPAAWRERFNLRCVTEEDEFKRVEKGDSSIEYSTLLTKSQEVMLKIGEETWSEQIENSKDGLLPKDVMAAIVSATYYAATVRGYEPAEALKLAAGASSQATITAVPSLEWLLENVTDGLTPPEPRSPRQDFDKSAKAGQNHWQGEAQVLAAPEEQTVRNESSAVIEALTIREVAKRLMAAGKGILAADESGGSIKKKFEAAGVPDDAQHRHDYRAIFLEAKGLAKYLSGVILFDETARDKAASGVPYPEALRAEGVIPGIKVDQGLADFGAGEKVTEGLDGLDGRLREYRQMGCRFAKWRAAFEVTMTTPSQAAITENGRRLAEYAKLCQENGIVPIVEPEVVYDGDYPLEAAAAASARVLGGLFEALATAGVDLEAVILKTNMVIAGKRAKEQTAAAAVGKATALTLRATVPRATAGVVFLSGGQSSVQATENLHAVILNGPFDWPVTFSFARALQDPALEVWLGDNTKTVVAREAFLRQLVITADALKR